MQKLNEDIARTILIKYSKNQPIVLSERRLAVRWTLQLASEKFPGKAVEVRVVPDGAVQIKSGVTNRRGTPSAVVELSPQLWIDIVLGKISWQLASNLPEVSASGTGTDLSEVFPLVDLIEVIDD